MDHAETIAEANWIVNSKSWWQKGTGKQCECRGLAGNGILQWGIVTIVSPGDCKYRTLKEGIVHKPNPRKSYGRVEVYE